MPQSSENDWYKIEERGANAKQSYRYSLVASRRWFLCQEVRALITFAENVVDVGLLRQSSLSKRKLYTICRIPCWCIVIVTLSSNPSKAQMV